MPEPTRDDFNKRVMAEFHENGGKVGGRLEGVDILILTSTGARTGQTRWHPLAYTRDGERFIIAASKGGAPTNPDWYHNLVANPSAVIEVGDDVIPVQASVAEGAERARLFEQHASKLPRFREYEASTRRRIPMIILSRRS